MLKVYFGDYESVRTYNLGMYEYLWEKMIPIYSSECGR